MNKSEFIQINDTLINTRYIVSIDKTIEKYSDHDYCILKLQYSVHPGQREFNYKDLQKCHDVFLILCKLKR